MTHPTHADSEVRDVVIAMVREFAGRRAHLSEETRLFHDLSISGDDAGDLLDNVHKRFGTDFSEMDFDEFFPNETEGIFYRRGRFLWFGRTKRESSLGHLLKVVNEGRWLDPEV